MPLAWTHSRLDAESGGNKEPYVILRRSHARTERPWILYVGGDDAALERSARVHLDGDVVSPPEHPPLPVAVHELNPLELTGRTTLYLPRLDRGLNAHIGCAGTALYLLASLLRLASSESPLGVVATAQLAGADDLVAQKGLASRFEIRRVDADTTTESDIEPSSAIDEATALGRVVHAVRLLSRNQTADAIAALEEALAGEPSLPAAHFELGKARLRADDIEGALEAFRRTTELLPEFASAWANMGAALGELRHYGEAVDSLRRAIALDPLNHAQHSSLGVAYRDQGKLEDAARAFEHVVSLAPNFVFGHYNLASVHHLEGRYDEAIAELEIGLTLDPKCSPRQALMLAATRLAAGDADGALRDYRSVLSRLDEPIRSEMRTIAEWDLKNLARAHGVSPELRDAARLLREV